MLGRISMKMIQTVIVFLELLAHEISDEMGRPLNVPARRFV